MTLSRTHRGIQHDPWRALHALSPLATILAIVLAMGVTGRTAQDPAPRPPPPADAMPLSRITPDAKIPVALGATAVATADGVWTATGAALVRIDAKTNQPGPPVTLPSAACASLVVAFDTVWAPLCEAGTVARVDVKSFAVTTPLTLRVADAAGRIDSAVGSVWIASEAKGVVSRIDPDGSAVVAEVFVARGPAAVAVGDEALWITSAEGDTLTRVNPHTNAVVETVKVGPKPGRVAVGEGGVWTLNRGDSSVSRVDPATNKVVATIAVDGAAGGDIAVGAGSVWVSAPGLPLVRIDPRRNRAVQRFTGAGGGAVVVAHGSVWLAAGAAVTWRLDPVLVATLRPE